jgi:dihydropteroate synthase
MSKSFSLRLRDDRAVVFTKPAIMGIVNVSPDSFFAATTSLEAVLTRVEAMVAQGVDIIDLGGEATNPSTSGLGLDSGLVSSQECERVLPALEAIRSRFDVLISIDTSNPLLMREAVALGADIINDQRALTRAGALEAVSELKVPVCLMHHFDPPRQPGSGSIDGLINQVVKDLQGRAALALEAGIHPERIILDPGFGQGRFGKNTDENFALLAQLPALIKLGYPVLSGWSRKSMISEVLGGRLPEARLYGSVAADSLATFLGVNILRGHDVQAMWDAARMARRLLDAMES